MTSLKGYLASRIGKPAPGLTLDEWAGQIAEGYIKDLEEHMKKVAFKTSGLNYIKTDNVLKFLKEGTET